MMVFATRGAALGRRQGLARGSLGKPSEKTTWHWFDFTCPFCYVARSRNEILGRAGLLVVDLPFQAHPEIPEGGIAMGPRSGEMYERLEQEARGVGLPLNWPAHLPNSRYALVVAEWVRRFRPDGFAALRDRLFDAHFNLGEDIGDTALVDRYVNEVGAQLHLVHAALSDGSASALVTESESAARRIGIKGTPAWLVGSRLVSGLQPKELFEQIGRDVTRKGPGSA